MFLRAMETVINQHGLDVEALMSSRLPSSSGSHVGESNRAQQAGVNNSYKRIFVFQLSSISSILCG